MLYSQISSSRRLSLFCAFFLSLTSVSASPFWARADPASQSPVRPSSPANDARRPTLTVLTDDNVINLLRTLQQKDVVDLHDSLAGALHTYSTGTQADGANVVNQPERTSVTLEDGSTTLWMPSKGDDSSGVKVVTVAGPGSNSPGPSIQGSVTLMNGHGAPVGLINAAELTAFRTALAATILLGGREQVSTITVFGAGKQAYWHIRLALLLRGADIKQVRIINRSAATAKLLLQALGGSADSPRIQGIPISIITLPTDGEYERLLEGAVRESDVIFCCTPSMDPLFPAAYLTDTEGQKKGRYITAIGSYTPQMTELAPELLRQVVASHGVIVVDTLIGCLKEAGEIIEAGLSPQQLVEVGKLVKSKQQTQRDPGHLEPAVAGTTEEGLAKWLRSGNVIYKSVGLGLMDLAVGTDLLKLAGERGVGTKIDVF